MLVGLQGVDLEVRPRGRAVSSPGCSRFVRTVVASRLFGALAGVLADGTLETHLTMACLEDDDAVAFATAALHQGQELVFPARPPEQA